MQTPAPDRESRAELRRLVFALRSGERRRIFPTRLHVGDPEGDQQEYVDSGEAVDTGLRADVLHTLLDGLCELEGLDRPDGVDGGSPAAVWLTRVGWPEPHDSDRSWLATVLQVFGERGVQPRWMAVVTKNGWYDAFGGEAVVWKRLRIR